MKDATKFDDYWPEEAAVALAGGAIIAPAATPLPPVAAQVRVCLAGGGSLRY